MGFYNIWDQVPGEAPRTVTEAQVTAFRAHIRQDTETARNVVRMVWLNQTPDERRDAVTIWDNDRGYNQEDAPKLTEIARKLWSEQELTPREDLVCKVHAEKYAAQFLHWSRFA